MLDHVLDGSGVVEATWLVDNLDVPGLVVAEVCWAPTGSSRTLYEQGHIPRAIFLDVDVDLAGPHRSGPGRHPLPAPESFAATMGGSGIRDDGAVVAYDRHGGSLAARLWWMLTVTGHAAAVLDGGLRAWPGDLQAGFVRRRPVVFHARPWPKELVVDADAVGDAIALETAVVLDARLPERYRGDNEPYDPVAGHVPGARSAPWTGNLDPVTERFLPPGALRARFEDLGVRDGVAAIAYCGSGVTACHDLLALKLAGLGDAALYEGSWSDWCSDPARPVAMGDEPAG